MSARDELTTLILGKTAPRAADAILAAGYRKLDMRVAPVGYEVTAAMVEDVWDTFVKPSQSDDAPPQSAEMRVLMAILRGVVAALEADQ